MTAVSRPGTRITSEHAQEAGRRVLPLLGLALIAALLPLRENWGVSLVLAGLCFTVPGVIALRALRVPSTVARDYPLYVPVAATLVIIGGGLGADLLGPHLGVASPLHGDTTAFGMLALAGVLWAAGLNAPDSARLPWRPVLSRPMLLVPLLLPAVSAYGALRMSAGQGATVARASIVLDTAVVLICLLWAKQLRRADIVSVLFCVALAVEWSWTLRGQGIIGFDISTELHIAQHTQAVGLWQTAHRNDAYGAMLSVGLMPSVIDALTGISPLIALKALYPVYAALLPVSLFLLGERLLSRRFAVGAAALLLVENYFMQQLPELARQEVALAFFAALIAAMIDRRMKRPSQTALILLCALGLVVSHYSSTYLALPLVILACVLRLLLGRFRGIPPVSVAWLVAAVALLGGSAGWYAGLTHSAENVSAFTSTISQRGLDLLPQSGNLLNSYLNGNNLRKASPARLEHLAVKQYRKTAAYIRPLASASSPRYDLRSDPVPRPDSRSPGLSSAVTVFVTIFNEALLLLCALGAVLMCLRRRWPPLTAELGILAVGALAFLVFIRISGTAASGYNQTRALLQSVIVLAIPGAWIAERIAGRLPWRPVITWTVLSLALVLMFAQQSGALTLALGGGRSLNLASGGEDYERLYQTPAELAAATYVAKAARHSILYADRYGQLRIYATSGRPVLTSVMPKTLDRYGWIYGTFTNTRLGRARAQVYNSYGTYRWPADYLDRFYDVVYDNGDSKIYHGR